MVDLLFITIASPMKIGVYQNYELLEEICVEGKTSDVLAPTFKSLEEKYDINEIFYVNGPGSFMAIKLSYVFFKTVSVVKNYNIYGTDGFEFNNEEPIPSIGKSFFVKENGKILIKKIDRDKNFDFVLPKSLEKDKFILNAEPLYVAPPV